MRKYHQKQLLDFMNTLHEAHAEIKRLYSEKEAEAVMGLLSGCQESAAQIGEFIEQLEGEGTKTVAFLEEYCDLLYQTGVALNDTGDVAGTLKRLQKQLHIIENSVNTEMKPDRIEMLFLPYKASMWDAMESVWLAAKEDPQCDAVVMPIPYYDRRPDGTLEKMYYEGNQYPDYVPVADWRKYNLEERRPDVIVVSNPYDEGNYITSIHPDYYNKRLKAFTDLLVYIPYFVTVDEGDEIFCVLAGTIHADRVFVQSEKVRQTYLRAFKNFEKKNNCKGRFGDAGTKFVASGSPKFDKVINTKREDCHIPDVWRKLIEKPDGSRRNVILYNTGIYGALSENEKALRKLRYVFDCFKGRDDTVLLWRPHPLSAAAYESMRPELLREYLDIVVEYKWQGFGIYDDTADMNRAIAISDAYYGDGGSLAALYQCTGKPVLRQNITVTSETENLSHLTFENLYDDGNSFWFTAMNFNGLFRMDKQTWKAEYKGAFIDEAPFGRLYASITGHTGKLFFVPYAADAIGVFDIAENKFEKIEIREPRQEAAVKYNPAFKFSFAAVYKEWVFLFPFTYPAILRYDTKTGELEYYDEWINSFEKSVSGEDAFYFNAGHVRGAEVTMFYTSANAVVVFDMEKCSLRAIHVLRSKDDRYASICFDGINYWLAPVSSTAAIIKLNAETGAKTEITQFPPGFTAGRQPIWSSVYADGYVWMLPGLANESLRINVETNAAEIADVFHAESMTDDGATEQWKFSFLKSAGDKLYAFDNTVKKLIEYDIGNQTVRKECIKFYRNDRNDPTLLDRFLDCYLRQQSRKIESAADYAMYESSYFTIRSMMNSMGQPDFNRKIGPFFQKQTESYRKGISHADGKAGFSIYMSCRKLLLNDGVSPPLPKRRVTD
jgi:hypothetical protein